MKRSVVFLGLSLALCSTVRFAQVPSPSSKMSPLLGVWKQNMAKSTYKPGPPPPVGLSAVRQYVAENETRLSGLSRREALKHVSSLQSGAASA